MPRCVRPGAAAHELDETTEGRLRLLREQFGVGRRELGFEVVRSGIGALDRILGDRARAGQETHLTQRGLRLGVVRLGVQDELVGRLGALEVAVLERLLGGLETRVGRLFLRFGAGRAGQLACDGVPDGVEPLTQRGLGLHALEVGERLAGRDRDDRGHRLDAEGLRDPRVGVDVDLREDPRAVRFVRELLENGRELLARLAPGRPQVDDHGHLRRPLQHLGFECRFGDVHDRGDGSGCGAVAPGRRRRRRRGGPLLER